MKQLQNNFTTVEQSKRLLELGVPADSADMYYKDVINTPYMFIPNVVFSKYKVVESITPCWSVGRLIEIYAITRDADFVEFDVYANSPCVLEEILDRIENNIDKLDFSRLEE